MDAHTTKRILQRILPNLFPTHMYQDNIVSKTVFGRLLYIDSCTHPRTRAHAHYLPIVVHVDWYFSGISVKLVRIVDGHEVAFCTHDLKSSISLSRHKKIYT